MIRQLISVLIVGASIMLAGACSAGEGQTANGGSSKANGAASTAQPTPGRNFTTADIARLKWIEGTWRGMDGDKPFYERYRIEENAIVVEGLKEDGTPDGEPGRFELKDGEFGKGEGDKRSAASEITADYIQFVPAVPGKGNSFRFTRQPDGTWVALLEWQASGEKAARQKTYKMERWEPTKK
jgi:hypothetical protein